MKKVITIIGIFGLIFVQAQVGVNNDTPNATLDVVAGKTDGSQVEGLLMPRISKKAAHAMAIAATKPQESNMVYVNDLSATFVPPTGGTTVENITEKGYYFWNGIKWVSVSTVEGSLWRYDNDKVFVDRNTVTDNIEYLKEGGYRHFPRNMRQVTSTDPTTGALVDITLDINSASIYNWNLSFSDLIKTKSLNTQWSYKALGQNSLYVDENETSSIGYYYANSNQIQTSHKTTRNFDALYGVVNKSSYFGQGNVIRLSGTISEAYLGSPNINVSGIHGTYNIVTLNGTSNTVGDISGTKNFATIRKNATVSNFIGTDNVLGFSASASPTITNLMTTKNYIYANENSGGQIENAFGSYTHSNFSNTSTLKINNMYGSIIKGLNKGQLSNYGIFIENVGNATATENYAIYTNAGKVHLGDDVNVVGEVKAQKAIFTNLPTYANHADADVLPSGSLYKLTGTGRQVFVRP